jgi:anti-sigma regulatory factor (Ser/Thr protein kinase)
MKFSRRNQLSHKFSVPSRLTPFHLFPFSVELSEAPISDSYLFDFQSVGHAEPFGMLFLAALIRQFARNRRNSLGKNLPIKVTNFENKSYVSWMGLFKSFGLNYGNEPGAASGRGTYIPITRLTVNRIVDEARSEFVHHGEVIEAEALRIAKILTQSKDDELTETLTFSIREIMRNVIEHGQTGHVWYAAQYWPSLNKVEVSILDEGIGIFESLKRNPQAKATNNKEAICLSLQPGVSGVVKSMRKKSDGDWRNSGYGLYMTRSLAQIGGTFLICGGDDALLLNNVASNFYPCSYKGVAVRFVLDTSKISDLNSSLAKIRAKGEKLALDMGNPDQELTASKMSRMLLNQIY